MTEAQLILVLDDSPTMRASVAFTLWAEGYHVRTVATRQEALAQLRRSERPCLLVLGQSFAQRMPRLRRFGVPVVVLGAERGGHSAANAGGAVGVLCKPVTDTKLLAVVRRHCGPPREQQGGSADANL